MDRTCSKHVGDKSVTKYFSRTTKGNRLRERKRKGKRERQRERQRERGVLLNGVCQLRRPHRL
jgi:hypothetical protein